MVPTMESPATRAYSSSLRNGRLKNATLEEITSGWSCLKRDHTQTEFDATKIRQALRKCFRATAASPDAYRQREDTVERITRSVVNTLHAQNLTCPEVEEVQRLVIQQLWAEGLFDAAEHYTTYRETRRQARTQKTVPVDTVALIEADRQHFPTDLQYFQFLGKFSRWRDDAGRRETWSETCDRFMGWFQKLPEVTGKLTAGEWGELWNAAYALEVSPAMRVIQMAGPALERCGIGAYNCAALPIKDLRAFAELLYILMQGSGCGFSVESEYIACLPRIKKQRGLAPTQRVIADDTEDWCNAYLEGLEAWCDGYDVEYDYSLIRPAGARLKTKGGRSGGPEPLRQLLTFARTLILARQGRHLNELDCHDLCCMTGKIVQVGGVRRASLISLSDLESLLMRDAKSGRWWESSGYRAMANNSAVYEERPDAETFMQEWLALVKSKSGERGIFNREACRLAVPDRRQVRKFLVNPCAEIILREYGLCNLSMCIARPDDTVETLKRKVRLATIFGVMQSTVTNFQYVRPEWRQNAEEERLLGVDITGHADCPLLQHGAFGREQLLHDLKQLVHQTKREFAKRFGIPESAADTCVKPGGDSGVFFDCASGVSPRFAKFQMRWVRESANSPLAYLLKDAGVPWAVAPEDPGLLVFGFPKQAPEGCTLRNDMTAIEQLENWKTWKQHWAEHSVSATIYVEPHEWVAAGNWVYRNFDSITGLSFLPKDNGSYSYAPNEELTEAQYDAIVAKFPKINWAKLGMYETEDQTESSMTPACVGGVCPRE